MEDLTAERVLTFELDEGGLSTGPDGANLFARRKPRPMRLEE